MTNKLCSTIARVMSVPVSQINDNSSPETIKRLDSFNGLVVVHELESEFNIKFILEEILDVKTVSYIKRHLKNHGVILDG